MLSDNERSRYSKQIILPEIGLAGQEKMSAAKVLVIGAGGLGCPILQYLAAAGIGTIGIADGDTIEISNLQRQILYNHSEIGQSKASTAARKIASLNPHVDVHVYQENITSVNALQILTEYDIIVDGSDNFATRYLLNDACIMLGKPMVSGAIYKFEGQLSVYNYQSGPTYRCIFPEPPDESDSPNCADIGVVATLPGIIGTLQANEVIKIITGIGEVLSGKLLVVNVLDMHMHIFHFRLVEANRNIKELSDAPRYCEIPLKDINYEQLQQMLSTDELIQLVDVREAEEHALDNIGGINIPLSVFETGSQKLQRERPVVLYCSSGKRSAYAASLLQGKGFTNVINLKNGVNDLQRS